MGKSENYKVEADVRVLSLGFPMMTLPANILLHDEIKMKILRMSDQFIGVTVFMF